MTDHDSTPSPLLPQPVEIGFAVVLIVALTVVFAKLVVPRFEKLYAERRGAIEGGLDRAQRTQAQADEALRQHTARLADARREVAALLSEGRREAAALLDEARAQAAVETEQRLRAARVTIENERRQAVAAASAEVGDLAVALAERIVGEALADSAIATRTVDRFLFELERSDDVGVAVDADGPGRAGGRTGVRP